MKNFFTITITKNANFESVTMPAIFAPDIAVIKASELRYLLQTSFTVTLEYVSFDSGIRSSVNVEF